MKKGLLLSAALLVSLSSLTIADPIPVSLELLLSIDVSGSVSATEYDLMMDGYAAAFQNAAVKDKITTSSTGIAVGVMQWSSYNQQSVRGWWLLKTDTDINNFTTTLGSMTRAYNGATGLSESIVAGTSTILNNNYAGTRLVMDVSGDGSDNSGSAMSVTAARDVAVAAGIVINGISIGTDEANIESYYANNVIGGTGSFGVYATDFSTFASAINTKIEKEIVNTPEPASASLFFMGLVSLLGLGIRRRRK